MKEKEDIMEALASGDFIATNALEESLPMLLDVLTDIRDALRGIRNK